MIPSLLLRSNYNVEVPHHITTEASPVRKKFSKAMGSTVMWTIPEVCKITNQNFARTTGVAPGALGHPK